MTRLVCLSDTHGSHHEVVVPDGDVLVFAGDACNYGTLAELAGFVDWFLRLPHRYKVFVAGNHDWPFYREGTAAQSLTGPDVRYLEDRTATLAGLTIHGSPWQPEFCNWAFNLPRGGRALALRWAQIPDTLDVLVTHGPPHGTLDQLPYTDDESRQYEAPPSPLGCERMAERVALVRPRLHVFGHIHGGYGVEQHTDGRVSANVSICTEQYLATNRPQVFEVTPDAVVPVVT